jgi:hypothetical protein
MQNSINRRVPSLPFVALLFSLVFLNGCAAIALALLGAGVGVATEQAVSYTMNGVASRTLTVPLPRVRRATLTALRRMGIRVEGRERMEYGEFIKATGRNRRIEVKLEPITPKSTRMRAVAKHGFFLRDRATATEIILQTESIIKGKS